MRLQKQQFLILLICTAIFELNAQQPPIIEPEYTSTLQQYCSISLNPDRSDRIWIVFDSNYVYIDSDLDGDLTDPDEKHLFFSPNTMGAEILENLPIFTSPEKDTAYLRVAYANAHIRAAHIRNGAGTYALPNAEVYLSCTLPDGLKLNGHFRSSDPYLPSSSKESTCLYFRGPLQIRLCNENVKLIRQREFQIRTQVNVGDQRNSNVVVQHYAQLPGKCSPAAEVILVDQHSKIILMKDFTLRERC